jgi:hypothetical protein
MGRGVGQEGGDDAGEDRGDGERVGVADADVLGSVGSAP